MVVDNKTNGSLSKTAFVNNAYDGSRPPSPNGSISTVCTDMGLPPHGEGMDPDSKRDVKSNKKGGFCWRLGRAIRGLWGTRMTENPKDREQYVKTTIRELIVYIFFLIDLCLLTFGMMSTNTYYYTKVMMDMFLHSPSSGPTFNTITNMQEFWKVLQGPIVDGLYWDKWYNDDPIDINGSFIYYENLLLGVPRIRQLKIKNGSCTVPKDFRKEIDSCYGLYTSSMEDKQTFGPGVGTATTCTQYRERTAWYRSVLHHHVIMDVFKHHVLTSCPTSRLAVFKYVSFNKTMTQLSSTLARCAKDILGFAVMFFIIFFAYAQLGYLIFGIQVKDFSTFSNCIFTQFRIILGDFDFPAIENANRILGPIYFTTYVFFVFFVLLNMFLAIINDTYSEVKEDLSKKKSEFELSDLIKKALLNVKTKFNRKSNKQGDSDAENNDIAIDVWKSNLQELGHSDEEIDSKFKQFDTDGDGFLSYQEQNNMKKNLEDEKDQLSKDIKAMGTQDEDGVNKGDCKRMNKQIDTMENNLDKMENKITEIMARMEALKGGGGIGAP
uniref:polycystin-2-like protein 1 n=1 Tax=Myxine glutinosa TaxID=7769 RepID=UPI00358FF19E